MSANEKNEIAETYPDLLLNLSDPHHLAALKHAATLSRGERSAVVMSTKKDEGNVHYLAV